MTRINRSIIWWKSWGVKEVWIRVLEAALVKKQFEYAEGLSKNALEPLIKKRGCLVASGGRL